MENSYQEYFDTEFAKYLAAEGGSMSGYEDSYCDNSAGDARSDVERSNYESYCAKTESEQLDWWNEPIDCICGRCGGPAKIHAIGPKGICICPKCTFEKGSK